MKKMLKKLRPSRKKTNWKPHKIKRTPFIFAVFFGLVMLAYGLTYIFAAVSPVIFSMSPTTQSATVGQTKTVALLINPNGDYVGGGGVRVTFDANRLTFNKFTAATGTPYNIFGQSSGTGTYTFSFYTNINTKQSATLGTLEFQIKPATSTTQTNLAYASGIYTRAYKGNIFNPSYRTLQLSGASITVQVPVVQPPPPTPPPSTNPTNPTNPTSPTSPTNNPSTPKPSTSSPNQKPTTTPSTNSPNQQPSSPSTENTDDPETVAQNDPTETDPGESDDETAAEDTGQAAAAAEKKTPFIALAAVAGGIALIAGAAFMYFGLRRKHGRLAKADSVHSGLFDDAYKSDKPHAKASPASTPPLHQTLPAAAPAALAAPQQPKAAPIPPKPTPAPQPTHPPTPPPQHPAAPPAPPKSQPQQAVAPPQPNPPKSPQPTNLQRAIPAWQAQVLANQQHKKVDDLPEDMFELAAEHPESFGSSQLLDAEEAAKQKPKGPHAT